MSLSAAINLIPKRKKGTAENPINLDSDLSSSDLDPDLNLKSSSKRVKLCPSTPSCPSLPNSKPRSSFFPTSKATRPLDDVSDLSSGSDSGSDSGSGSITDSGTEQGSKSGSDSGSDSGSESDGMTVDAAGRNAHADFSVGQGQAFDLNDMLHFLDRMSRSEHMARLAHELQKIRNQVAELGPVGKIDQASFDKNVAEFASRVDNYHDLKARELTPRETLAAHRAELLFLERELEGEERQLGYMRRAEEYYKQWVMSLSAVRDTYTQMWDVYDSMTKPGPSSVPVRVKELWDIGYGIQLHTALKEARAKVVEARAEVNDCLGHMREDSGSSGSD